MTAARARERYFARRRQAARATRESKQVPVVCRRCYGAGHDRSDCTVPLRIWTNGPDMMIAVDAERAARIWNDPLGPDSPDDWYSSPADWRPVEVDTAEISGWIDLYGEGFLVVDGELAPRADD